MASTNGPGAEPGRNLWNTLPNELKLKIMDCVANGPEPCAPVAAVSREFRDLIAPHTFKRLRLTKERLDDFYRMTCQNSHLVQYIWLILELERHSCLDCGDESEDGFESDEPEGSVEDDRFAGNRRECAMLETSLQKFFCVLNLWKARGERGNDVTYNKLVVDIGAYSPSDYEHSFRYRTCVPNWIVEDRDWCDQFKALSTDETRRPWLSPCESPFPTRLSVHQAFSDIHPRLPNWSSRLLCKEAWERVPQAPAVTTIMVRQQNRRRWNPDILGHIISRCPNIEEFHYEPWREWCDDSVQRWTDRYYRNLFNSLPPLRNLVIFENFQESYRIRVKRPHLRTITDVPCPALLKASLPLERLSVSYMVDAQDFFSLATGMSGCRWDNLKSFAMTSPLLSPAKQSDFKVDAMLIAAADVAARMPKLQVMELWFARIGAAMVFRYEREPLPTVVCRGSWQLHLSREVRNRWDNFSSKAYLRPVRFRREEVNPALIISHAAAISELELVSQVIQPISQQQIQIEICQRNRMIMRQTRTLSGNPPGNLTNLPPGPHPGNPTVNPTAVQQPMSWAAMQALAYAHLLSSRSQSLVNRPVNPPANPPVSL